MLEFLFPVVFQRHIGYCLLVRVDSTGVRVGSPLVVLDVELIVGLVSSIIPVHGYFIIKTKATFLPFKIWAQATARLIVLPARIATSFKSFPAWNTKTSVC